MNKSHLITAIAALSLAAPAAAGAHVTVQPKQAEAGSFTVLNVRVPNERDDASTTKVDVQLPDGIAFVSYQPVPGWKVKVTREKPAQPLVIHGEEVTEQVARVTFTGDGEQGAVRAGQFRDFPLSVSVPDAAAGTELTFKAVQTYSSGEVVRWIGAQDSDNPAPTLTLTAAGGSHGATTPAAGSAPASAVGAGDDGGDGDGLAIAALIVGALGLLAGVAGLAAARRAR